MGKASSAKKVARAARAGGSASADQRKIGYPAAIAVILLLGVGLVVYARDNRPASASAPTFEDHWHYAYGVYACGTGFVQNLSDLAGDPLGIHTHEDGVVHIHPFSSAATGKNATFGKFADDVGIVLTDDSFTLPDGTTYTNGDDCQGKPGRVVLARWPADAPDADPELFTEGFADVRFVEDRGVITLAFLPEDADVPRPESVAELDSLSDVEPGASPVTTVIEAGGTTTISIIDPTATAPPPTDPTATTGSTDSTTPGDSTTSSAPGDTTTSGDPSASTSSSAPASSTSSTP